MPDKQFYYLVKKKEKEKKVKLIAGQDQSVTMKTHCQRSQLVTAQELLFGVSVSATTKPSPSVSVYPIGVIMTSLQYIGSEVEGFRTS